VHVGKAEFLQDILRGVALQGRIAARRRCEIRGVQGVEVVRLRDRDQVDRGERPDDLGRGLADANAPQSSR
jgi:hypothetical protein